ncbi:MAG: response regulator [Deltaproteobacteria bacterium]|nr:response regulator [Deltaproteobacteria bacterium]
MTKLFILSGGHKGQSFDLRGGAVHVGRSPENQIQIHDKSVSRKHMKILSKEGKWFIVDLKSTNGTFVANKPIEPGTEVEIAEGLPVTIGNVGICLGKPEKWDCLAVEDSIDLSDGFKETGVFDRPMTSPKNLELIFKISNVLMESLKINEILEKVLDYIFELLQRIDRGVIILVEGETGKILDVISRTSDRGDKTTQMYSRSIVDRVIKERRALMMSDTLGEQKGNYSASMEMMKVRSVMCVPLISRSQIRGVLYVDSVDKPFGFRKEDLALLSALSAPAAIAIENALLYSRLESLVEKRTRSLRETQDKLRESEARFKAIFDHMSSGVVVYRPMNQAENFHVLDLNRADESLEKVKDRKEILGKGMVDAFPELKKTQLLQVMRRVWKTGMPERCSLSLSEGEKLQWWREYYVYRLPSGEVVTIFDDITQVKKVEEEQKALQMQLLFSQKMESVGAFASGTAHNFRNILQAISGNMEYLEMTRQEEPEVKEVARSIYDSVEKGVDLINNLLHFSRTSGKYEFSHLDLADVAKNAIGIIRKVFDNNIEIHADLQQGVMVSGNHSLLSQVYLNLFTNARDAMPNGGKLSVEVKGIRGRAVVRVTDTGIGMDREVLGRIFDPFFTLKEVGKGTGLGLSTTHGIVQEHKGSVSVSSTPGVGTTFTISFPAVRAEKLPRPEPERKLILGKGEKVLIVDDELPALDALNNMIKRLGYETIAVDKPEEALRKYLQWSPDITLMDRNMPGMDGITCIREILKKDPGARILVVSGYDQTGPDGMEEEVRAMIRGYLTKPCGIEELGREISRVLGSPKVKG